MDDMEEFTGLTIPQADVFTRYSLDWSIRDTIKNMTSGFVLEAGCGNGNNTGRYPKDQYLGIDISQPLLDAAKRLHPNHEFLLFNGFEIPSFDRRRKAVAKRNV